MRLIRNRNTIVLRLTNDYNRIESISEEGKKVWILDIVR